MPRFTRRIRSRFAVVGLVGDQPFGLLQRAATVAVADTDRRERGLGECGFTGGCTIVEDYVRGEQVRSREMFLPLTHAPDGAQADFGEALVVIAGVQQKAHYLVVDLPPSDDCFMAAFPAERTEAFLEAMCVPTRASAVCPHAYFKPTRRSRWPRSWVEKIGN
jgi:hypothetical protein